jgi:flagellum-specific ATP synthase
VNRVVVDLSKYQRRLRQADLMPYRGTVVRVSGMKIESKGPPVGVGQLCEIRLSGGRRVLAEVVGFQDAHRILLPLEGTDGIAPNDPVIARSSPRTIRLDETVLGRVVDGLGRPIDGKGPLGGAERRRLDGPAPLPLARQKITEPLAFGIRSLDGLLTCGKGQRIGIFSGSGVGKSTLLGEIARTSAADVNVVALIGERGREVRSFLDESLGPEGLARSVVVVAPADTSPIQRVKGAFAAITVAEYFRDRGRDVLFMMDSLTRFAQAQREIGLAAGEPPTTRSYCPSVFGVMPRLTERLGRDRFGSITGVLTILVEGDDMADPVADAARSLLDGHIVLSRRLAEQGHYPAVDILQSVSRLMTAVTSPPHQDAARKFKAIYATYQNAEDLINIGAFSAGSNRRIDKAISLIERVNEFLVQPCGTRGHYEQTVQWLCDVTASWDDLLAGQGAEAKGGGERDR